MIEGLAIAGGAACLGLAAIGSAVGCYIAGTASHGAMAKVDEGHGKLIGMSAAPSSQTIYGLVLMFVIMGAADKGPAFALFMIGVCCGAGIMVSAIMQGIVCATGIQASTKKPEIYGKCFAAVGMTESFALFALVGGIIMVGAVSG